MKHARADKTGTTRRGFIKVAGASMAAAAAAGPLAVEAQPDPVAPPVDWTDTVMIARGCQAQLDPEVRDVDPHIEDER